MACGPSKWKMAVGLTNLKVAFGPGLKMFFGIFWSQIRPYGLKLRSSILTFQGASFGVHGSPCRPHIWRNLWIPKTRKVLKNQPCKNCRKTLNLVWNGFRKFNLGHGDLDPAPNFDPDALVIVPDPKNLIFDPKYRKMTKKLKRNWIAFWFLASIILTLTITLRLQSRLAVHTRAWPFKEASGEYKQVWLNTTEGENTAFKLQSD